MSLPILFLISFLLPFPDPLRAFLTPGGIRLVYRYFIRAMSPPLFEALYNLTNQMNENKPKVMAKNPEEKAYAQGAAEGAFHNLLGDAGWHIGLFLNRKEGGRLAQVSKTAHDAAATARQVVLDTKKQMVQPKQP